MKVAIVIIGWVQFGGWPTYVKHLCRGLASLGIEHGLITTGESPRVEWRSVLPLVGWDYLDGADLIFVSCYRPDPVALRPVKESGLPVEVLLHDPTEWAKPNSIQWLRWLNPVAIQFIGDRPRETFLVDAPDFPAPTYVHRHPYARVSEDREPGPPFPQRAVCTARIDFDKRTHIVTAANEVGAGVELWAGYIDWRYNLKCWGGKVQDLPEYKGKFGVDDAAIRQVYEGACALVDMSHIKGDGGRTQYTFLEAMDFGLDLVLAADWGSGELVPNRNYHAARSVRDILDCLDYVRTYGNAHAGPNAAILRAHDAGSVAAGLVEHWKTWAR